MNEGFFFCFSVKYKDTPTPLPGARCPPPMFTCGIVVLLIPFYGGSKGKKLSERGFSVCVYFKIDSADDY